MSWQESILRNMATIKQKKAFKEVVNGSTLTKAMKVAGYSEETAKRTNKLTATGGWQELMDKHLPDSELAKVHKEGLHAYKVDRVTLKIGGEEELSMSNDPDFQTRHKYLDSAYKLKGMYAPDKSINLHLTQVIENRVEIERIASETSDQLLHAETNG